MTPRLVRHDMTERSDTADMIEPKLANEPIENADANDPILPMESTEPIEPMERIDPRDPMLRIDPSDLIDNKDRCDMHPSWPFAGDRCSSTLARTRAQDQHPAGRRRGGRWARMRAVALAEVGEVDPAADRELAVDRGEVALYRSRTEEQFGRDLLVVAAGGSECRDPVLG